MKKSRKLLSRFMTLIQISTISLLPLANHSSYVYAADSNKTSYLKDYNADAIYGSYTNPKTKPHGIDWGTDFNSKLVSAALQRAGKAYVNPSIPGQKVSWLSETAYYDCSNFVYWSLTSVGFKASTNAINGELPWYAWGGGNCNSFYNLIENSHWYDDKQNFHHLCYQGKTVPILRCYDIDSYGKAIIDPDFNGWFITLSPSDVNNTSNKNQYTYRQCMENDVLKPGTIITSGWTIYNVKDGVGHAAISLGHIPVDQDYKETKGLGDDSPDVSKYRWHSAYTLQGQRTYTSFASVYPRSVYKYPVLYQQYDLLQNSDVDTLIGLGKKTGYTWKSWYSSSGPVCYNNSTETATYSKNGYSSIIRANGANFKQGTAPTTSPNGTWTVFRVDNMGNDYFKIEAGSPDSGVNINNLGWTAPSKSTSSDPMERKVILGYFNDYTDPEPEEEETKPETKPEQKPEPKPEQKPENPYSDVPNDAWYTSGVLAVYKAGAMTGKSEGIFAPFDDICRSEAIELFYKLEGKPKISGEALFPDVTPGNWYYASTNWGKTNGIIGGMSSGEMAGFYLPHENIIRQDFMKILYNYAKLKGYDTDVFSSKSYLSVPDGSTISGYAIECMNWGYEKGLIAQDSNFNPKNNISRREVAVILARFLG